MVIVERDFIFAVSIVSFIIGGIFIGTSRIMFLLFDVERAVRYSKKRLDKAVQYDKEASNIIKNLAQSRLKAINVFDFSSIKFKGMTNSHNYFPIKVARFKNSDGEEIKINRLWTDIVQDDDGEFSMIWQNCYIVDNNNEHIYLTKEENDDMLNDLKFDGFEMFVDTPEDYKLDVTACDIL